MGSDRNGDQRDFGDLDTAFLGAEDPQGAREMSGRQRDWMTLALVPGVGGTRFVRLMARFGSPAKVLAAAEAELAEVVGKSVARNIRQYRDAVDTETQERLMRLHGAAVITMDDPGYPTLLAEIYDPPLMLFVRGALCETDQYAVAIVGTRRPSHYGAAMAERLERLGTDATARVGKLSEAAGTRIEKLIDPVESAASKVAKKAAELRSRVRH